MSTKTSTTSNLDEIPPGSWDSHMHIVDLSYPIVSSSQYAPHSGLLPEALSALSRVHMPNLVLVQPSIYGNENSCLLNALKTLGRERARGVVQFDPETIQREQLREWHHLGVRGVRLNLKSTGLSETMHIDTLKALLCQYADVIRELDWMLDLHIDLHVLPALETTLMELGVKVAIAHLGYPEFSVAESRGHLELEGIPGYAALKKLLAKSDMYIKLSAPYRLSKNQHMRDVELLTKDLLSIEACRRKMVVATDWPHTRYDGFDILPFIEKCVEWCDGDKELIRLLFRDNAEKLFDVIV